MEQPFVFGAAIPGFALVSERVVELLEQAGSRQRTAARLPLSKIFEILGRVSAIWGDHTHPLYQEALAKLPGVVAFSKPMIREGLAVVSALCRPETLRRRLEGEFGNPGLLETWVPKPGFDFDLRVVPRGPVLHLAAGNVFVGAVDSLLSGIITRNANLLKMSHADPVFPVLFLESLREADPEGLLWPNQAILAWKGGDASVEDRLLKSDLTVVFWGGREALASVRTRIGEGTRLIENGPRYSFALTDGKTLATGVSRQTLRGLALDLIRWDQQACSSPHVVYCIDADETAVFALMDGLFDELETMARELPIGALSFDEKVEIRRNRELAQMAQAMGEGRLRAPEAFDFTLIYERDPRFKVSCLNRTLFFKRVESLDAVMQEIEPIRSFLQTVGMHLSPDLGKEAERRLLEIGACRLTGWGGMSEGRDGAPHEGSFLLTRLVDWVDREGRPRLEARLERLFAAMQRSPYYSPLLERVGGTALAKLLQFPMLDRDTYYRHSPPVSNDIFTGPLQDAYVYASGGTTGEPKFTLYSNEEYRSATDSLGFIYRVAGLTAGDVVGNLFLAGNLWTSFNVAGRALENIGCLNLPIGGASEMANVISYLRIFKATAVVGLPSIIVKLAEEVQKSGVPLQIKKILYGGEHLRPATVAFLERTLGCTWVRSAGYACVDTGPIGFQCTHLEGTVHHVLDDYTFLELIDPATGRHVESGQAGEIVATNLDRILMPVVRYRTGDLGRWVETPVCPCGFGGRSFELLGRCDDLLVIGGINLLPSDVAPGLALLPVSQNFQIVARLVEGKECLHLRLEAETAPALDRVRAALASGSYKLTQALDGWLMLTVECVPPGALPRNPRTGKLKVVLDERD